MRGALPAGATLLGWPNYGVDGRLNKFILPFEPYVETCTSFYVFSGLKWLDGRVGYWTPSHLHCRSSASHHWSPPYHKPQHTIGNECASRYGAISPYKSIKTHKNDTKCNGDEGFLVMLCRVWPTFSVDFIHVGNRQTHL